MKRSEDASKAFAREEMQSCEKLLMRKNKKLKPVHPGEILHEEFMKPLGLSMNRMALDLRVPLTHVADIVHERRGITTDTALRLARYFKTSPRFWLNLQTGYDLEIMGGREADRIARDVHPLETDVAREV
jgi:addiction module HigA family antidote